ncbi:nucleotidyl transferase AbiEii/AbiGii toxin family protein [uncultured Hyphomonas sp.]|uniref:nucleotidyl transferase AbiEii/AbiGii toxin family protein n=1 Tax=uncultured Hyphomonas sp. TaxID=225298 RepID=UPI002AAC2BFD|nr:nucleotidyl transferase AbiEii/AbiGii toxin family protein [uncultured Hyphomonas sp.]
MSDPILKIDIQQWVERAREDPSAYRARQATEIVLNAIALTAPLNQKLFLKGGILMGLAYDSPRQTTDVDLTTDLDPGEQAAEEVKAALNGAFPAITARLGYAGLHLQVHTMRLEPRNQFDGAEFPAIKLKIGYAEIGTPAHRALVEGRAAITIEVDISFNEPMSQIQVLEMPEGAALHAYSLTDLIAEKYRAMLQQVTRRRNRRQDVYDLDYLIASHAFGDAERKDILTAFLTKARARHLDPGRESLGDEEVRRRSGAEWETLRLELGDVPEFGPCYDRVEAFYRSLPW